MYWQTVDKIIELSKILLPTRYFKIPLFLSDYFLQVNAEIEVTMEDHKLSPWGIGANLDDHYSLWTVTTIYPNTQSFYKNIKIGYKYKMYNGDKITDDNYLDIKQKLMNGNPCTILFTAIESKQVIKYFKFFSA